MPGEILREEKRWFKKSKQGGTIHHPRFEQFYATEPSQLFCGTREFLLCFWWNVLRKLSDSDVQPECAAQNPRKQCQRRGEPDPRKPKLPIEGRR